MADPRPEVFATSLDGVALAERMSTGKNAFAAHVNSET
jgi:hypothetical protein